MYEQTTAREIDIRDIRGLRIGNAEDQEAKTGVTVLLFNHGATVGVDVSGGGPASRENLLADPLTADNPVNAIVLSGGSAFGLAASDGVMRYLESRGIGYDTGFAKVPLVCQACIYDLGIGRADVRPDAGMGYEACKDAEENHPQCGNVGAGCGATVGKICGMERASKSGLGIYAAQVGELKVGAVVALNALGDIYDPGSGKKIAGLRGEDGSLAVHSCDELYKICERTDLFNSNTTIGAIVTNGKFSKAEMSKIASMARCAYARCINPVGTMADGDTIYGAALGEVEADINVAGVLAAEVLSEAIIRAAKVHD
ncbi:MAG: P1 family peptidase [Eubacteriales bacterium]|nr:P1 family peptidase [Eubacteriales bacterium]